MAKKAPNKYFAPIIIAGITVGFFVSAYKFVFAKPKANTMQQEVEDSSATASEAKANETTDEN